MAISKATAYRERIFTVEYDLHGMLQAYGKSKLLWLIGEIEAGNVITDQHVDRWAANSALYYVPAIVKPIKPASKKAAKSKSKKAA